MLENRAYQLAMVLQTAPLNVIVEHVLACCLRAAQLDELMRQEMEVNEKQELVKEELRARCKEKCQQADAERNNYLEFKKAVALNSFSSRSGKPVSPKVSIVIYSGSLGYMYFLFGTEIKVY